MNIPLAFGGYTGRSPVVNATRMTNMMVENDQQGGAASYYLVNTPGCLEYIDTALAGKGRGGFVYPGYCLCVIGARVYLINTSDASYSQVGLLSTSTGTVQFCENPDQVMLIDGTYGYVFTKATGNLARITDGDFPTPLSCTFKDGYGAVVKSSTGQSYVSGINDFSSWNALAFATAEFEPDNLMGVKAGPDSLFAFGEKTVQVYYNSGDSTYPFDPRIGANMQVGCGATNSIAGGFNLIFWLDNYGGVRMIQGYTPAKISSDQIDYKISQLTTTSDAVGSVYAQQGHIFYVLSFLTEAVTYVYDVTTQQWHDRTSGNGRWRPAWIAQDENLVLAGDYENGKIYQLDPDTYTDDSDEIRWFTTTQNVNKDRNMLAHDILELHIQTGTAGQGEDPQLWMQYSDDDGRSWSNENWRSMGQVGEYDKRLTWGPLGQSRSRIYRFGGSDAIEKILISANLKVRDLGY